MTNKIKLLLWSLFTIIFVWLYSTYAYDLWGSASQESREGIIKNVCFKNRKRDSNNYSNWKCPAWEFYIPHGPDPSWFYFYAPLNPYPHFFFLNIQKNGEWFIFRRSIWKNWGLSIKDFSFPSKSWFEYIDPKGKKSILTKVYYWHNTAYFFDPDTMHWFSFIGDRALWNLFLVANPFKDENNLYLINFHNKTAYSKTVDTKIALQYMLGDPQYIDKIKEIKWETSYTLVPWGNEVLPPNFDTTNYGSNWRLWSQGESKGWNYVEDLTVKSPNWYEWSNKSNAETTGNTVAKNATREEKKSCVAYYTYMRSMSSHSDWCLWEVNKDMSDTRLDYWWAISTDWDLSKFWVRDKTKYRRCWHWNNYKEGVKKTLWDKWPEFWKDRQTNYIATEAKDIDVNALCSHIVLSPSEKLAEAKDNSSIWKKIAWIWNGNSGDPLTVDWSWNALYQNDFQNELRDLQPYYWQCQSYDKYWLKKISISENERSNACKLYEKKKKKLIEKWKWVELEYTNDSTVEWQVKLLEKRLWNGKGMLESVWYGVSNTLSEWWEVLFKTVKDPFYSGYNAIIPLQCNNSYRIEFMDIFLYALFWIIVFILFRSL